MSLCRSCGAEIRWVVSSNGKSMPLDATPDPAGLVAVHNGVAHVGRNMVEGEQKFTSHFATCPNARDHRKDVQNRRDGRGRKRTY